MSQASAPQIPGFVYKRDLGAGGFADVYLYERVSPRRDVAVKVLRSADMSEKLVRRFTAEADTMAALGDHPNIVQVFGSGVSADARPYIEMAYYPGKSLADTLKTVGPFAVADVLRIGVQLSSAIETAHRAGLLHRDIKPANVLIDQFGDPAITDFGIASRLHEDDDDSSLSLPWAPPEAMFSTSPVDVRSDVYSLGALLWNLLVGRAPYEIPGGDNRPSAMMIRTRDLSVPATGRGDVPQSLERLLAQAMNKNPALRPQSAASLARSLNAVEAELRFTPTPFKVAIDFEQPPVAPKTGSEDHTRRQSAMQVVSQPMAPGDQPQLLSPVLGGVAGLAPQMQPPRATTSNSTTDATVRRGAAKTVTAAPPEAAPVPVVAQDTPASAVDKSHAGLIAAAALIVVVAIAVGSFLIWGRQNPNTSQIPTITLPTPDPDTQVPPGIVKITCERAGTAVSCSWTYERALANDTYQVKLPDGTVVTRDEAKYELDPAPEGFCIAVKVFRFDGSYPATKWSREECA